MKKSRYSETQIVRILKEVEAGKMVKDVCREYSISDATYYNWKAKYGGMEASDIKRLKELESENQRLKEMFAELSQEGYCRKKALRPAARRELVDYAMETHCVSPRLACRVVGISRSVYRYQPDKER
ncbi:transposase, partial [Solemya velum gill symbiont]|uniref:transposase n=1 Tax=Solemya velum gill symbiont TaxID=2340 RepID=UPI00117AEF48